LILLNCPVASKKNLIFYNKSLIWREELRLRVSKNRVLGRIFGTKRDEVPMEWRKLHNEELNDQYSSLSIFWVIKSRRMRWAGHVSRMVRGEACKGFRWGSLKERN
jgi:hypothetical protein